MIAIPTRQLWTPWRDLFAPRCLRCGKPQRQPSRLRRWANALFAAGQDELDSSGHLKLKSTGETRLDDGTGSCCCVAACPTNCTSMPSTLTLSGWNNTITNGCGCTGCANVTFLIDWDGTMNLDSVHCRSGDAVYFNNVPSGYTDVRGYFTDGNPFDLGDTGSFTQINCGALDSATGHGGAIGWTLFFAIECDGGAVCTPGPGDCTDSHALYYKLGSSPIGTYARYQDSGNQFGFPLTMTAS